MNFRKVGKVTLLVAVLGAGLVFVLEYCTERIEERKIFDQPSAWVPIVEEERVIPAESVISTTEAAPAVEPVRSKIWPAVPFISQAPTSEWGKSEFQNGCEEASAIMVHAWRTGQTYTRETAKQTLIAMARYQEKKIGQGIDTDARDTADILLRGYFDISAYRLVYDFSLDDLQQATAEGIILVPANGQALKNPNFTRPGPLQHMLVVTGYDVMTKEFITNDPGTRKGKSYRYPEQILFAAIREYPTGKHLPIQTERKAMIIVLPGANP